VLVLGVSTVVEHQDDNNDENDRGPAFSAPALRILDVALGGLS
jgi:hypothetical protein